MISFGCLLSCLHATISFTKPIVLGREGYKNVENWRKTAKTALLQGKSIQINPRGDSMRGKIHDGSLVTLQPCKTEDLNIGDIVLVDVHGKKFTLTVLHLIVDVGESGFLIGNNKGRIDGWVEPKSVYGKVIDIQDEMHTE